MARQRGGHADQQDVGLTQPVEIGGGVEPARFDLRGDPGTLDMLDIALAGLERVDLRIVEVEGEHRATRLAECNRERQADIAHPDHADLRSAAFDTRLKLKPMRRPFDTHVRPRHR